MGLGYRQRDGRHFPGRSGRKGCELGCEQENFTQTLGGRQIARVVGIVPAWVILDFQDRILLRIRTARLTALPSSKPQVRCMRSHSKWAPEDTWLEHKAGDVKPGLERQCGSGQSVLEKIDRLCSHRLSQSFPADVRREGSVPLFDLAGCPTNFLISSSDLISPYVS